MVGPPSQQLNCSSAMLLLFGPGLEPGPGSVGGRGSLNPLDCDMNKVIGLQLVLYSLLLAGGSYLTHHLAPTSSAPTLLAGLAGGALCLAWGLWAMAGRRGKALPILTLMPVSFVLLSQAVHAWSGAGERAVAALVTLLLALSIAMLMRIAYAGVLFDAPAAMPPKPGPVATEPNGPARGSPNRLPSGTRDPTPKPSVTTGTHHV